MRIIALEEHVATPLYHKHLPPRRTPALLKRAQVQGQDVVAELEDFGPSRLKHMDAVGIDMQVLSLTQPGLQAFPADIAVPMATDTNDRVYEAVKAHPTRFAGFAALPTADVAASVRELERCITKLGFKGTMINGHYQGSYLDDRKYWPIFETAQALDVPIYIHPREPPPEVAKVYFDGFPELRSASWGFAMETCTHFFRLMFAGVFDAFPRLRIILGHLGEGIPFWLDRFDDHARFPLQERGLKRTPREYILQNLSITCSGNFSMPAFLCSVMALGIDNVMFSVDYPYEGNKFGVDFLHRLPFAEADKAKIAHKNAERILKL